MDCKKSGALIRRLRLGKDMTQSGHSPRNSVSSFRRCPNGSAEFPIVKDTTPNMMNPRLYTTSYNKP